MDEHKIQLTTYYTVNALDCGPGALWWPSSFLMNWYTLSEMVVFTQVE